MKISKQYMTVIEMYEQSTLGCEEMIGARHRLVVKYIGVVVFALSFIILMFPARPGPF